MVLRIWLIVYFLLIFNKKHYGPWESYSYNVYRKEDYQYSNISRRQALNSTISSDINDRTSEKAPTNLVSDSGVETDKQKEMEILKVTFNVLSVRDFQEKNTITTTATEQPLASKPENVEVPTRNIFSESLSTYIPTEMSTLSRTVLTEINSTPTAIEAGISTLTATTNQNLQLLSTKVGAYKSTRTDTTSQTDTTYNSTQSIKEASTQTVSKPIKDLPISSFMGKATLTETFSSEGSSVQTQTEAKTSTRTRHNDISSKFKISIPSAITYKWLIPSTADGYMTMKTISRGSTDTSTSATANTSTINVTTKTQSKFTPVGTSSPPEAAATSTMSTKFISTPKPMSIITPHRKEYAKTDELSSSTLTGTTLPTETIFNISPSSIMSTKIQAAAIEIPTVSLKAAVPLASALTQTDVELNVPINMSSKERKPTFTVTEMGTHTGNVTADTYVEINSAKTSTLTQTTATKKTLLFRSKEASSPTKRTLSSNPAKTMGASRISQTEVTHAFMMSTTEQTNTLTATATSEGAQSMSSTKSTVIENTFPYQSRFACTHTEINTLLQAVKSTSTLTSTASKSNTNSPTVAVNKTWSTFLTVKENISTEVVPNDKAHTFVLTETDVRENEIASVEGTDFAEGSSTFKLTEMNVTQQTELSNAAEASTAVPTATIGQAQVTISTEGFTTNELLQIENPATRISTEVVPSEKNRTFVFTETETTTDMEAGRKNEVTSIEGTDFREGYSMFKPTEMNVTQQTESSSIVDTSTVIPTATTEEIQVITFKEAFLNDGLLQTENLTTRISTEVAPNERNRKFVLTEVEATTATGEIRKNGTSSTERAYFREGYSTFRPTEINVTQQMKSSSTEVTGTVFSTAATQRAQITTYTQGLITKKMFQTENLITSSFTEAVPSEEARTSVLTESDTTTAAEANRENEIASVKRIDFRDDSSAFKFTEIYVTQQMELSNAVETSTVIPTAAIEEAQVTRSSEGFIAEELFQTENPTTRKSTEVVPSEKTRIFAITESDTTTAAEAGSENEITSIESIDFRAGLWRFKPMQRNVTQQMESSNALETSTVIPTAVTEEAQTTTSTEEFITDELIQTENPTTRTSTEVAPSEKTHTFVLTETDTTSSAEASRENDKASINGIDFRDSPSTFKLTKINVTQQMDSSNAVEMSKAIPSFPTEEAQVAGSSEGFIVGEPFQAENPITRKSTEVVPSEETRTFVLLETDPTTAAEANRENEIASVGRTGFMEMNKVQRMKSSNAEETSTVTATAATEGAQGTRSTEGFLTEKPFQTENSATGTSAEVVSSEKTHTFVFIETDTTTAAEGSRENEIASTEGTEFRKRPSTFISTETNMIQQTMSSSAVETNTVVPTAAREDAYVTTYTEEFITEEPLETEYHTTPTTVKTNRSTQSVISKALSTSTSSDFDIPATTTNLNWSLQPVMEENLSTEIAPTDKFSRFSVILNDTPTAGVSTSNEFVSTRGTLILSSTEADLLVRKGSSRGLSAFTPTEINTKFGATETSTLTSASTADGVRTVTSKNISTEETFPSERLPIPTDAETNTPIQIFESKITSTSLKATVPAICTNQNWLMFSATGEDMFTEVFPSEKMSTFMLTEVDVPSTTEASTSNENDSNEGTLVFSSTRSDWLSEIGLSKVFLTLGSTKKDNVLQKGTVYLTSDAVETSTVTLMPLAGMQIVTPTEETTSAETFPPESSSTYIPTETDTPARAMFPATALTSSSSKASTPTTFMSWDRPTFSAMEENISTDTVPSEKISTFLITRTDTPTVAEGRTLNEIASTERTFTLSPTGTDSLSRTGSTEDPSTFRYRLTNVESSTAEPSTPLTTTQEGMQVVRSTEKATTLEMFPARSPSTYVSAEMSSPTQIRISKITSESPSSSVGTSTVAMKRNSPVFSSTEENISTEIIASEKTSTFVLPGFSTSAVAGLTTLNGSASAASAPMLSSTKADSLAEVSSSEDLSMIRPSEMNTKSGTVEPNAPIPNSTTNALQIVVPTVKDITAKLSSTTQRYTEINIPANTVISEATYNTNTPSGTGTSTVAMNWNWSMLTDYAPAAAEATSANKIASIESIPMIFSTGTDSRGGISSNESSSTSRLIETNMKSAPTSTTEGMQTVTCTKEATIEETSPTVYPSTRTPAEVITPAQIVVSKTALTTFSLEVGVLAEAMKWNRSEFSYIEENTSVETVRQSKKSPWFMPTENNTPTASEESMSNEIASIENKPMLSSKKADSLTGVGTNESPLELRPTEMNVRSSAAKSSTIVPVYATDGVQTVISMEKVITAEIAPTNSPDILTDTEINTPTQAMTFKTTSATSSPETSTPTVAVKWDWQMFSAMEVNTPTEVISSEKTSTSTLEKTIAPNAAEMGTSNETTLAKETLMLTSVTEIGSSESLSTFIDTETSNIQETKASHVTSDATETSTMALTATIDSMGTITSTERVIAADSFLAKNPSTSASTETNVPTQTVVSKTTSTTTSSEGNTPTISANWDWMPFTTMEESTAWGIVPNQKTSTFVFTGTNTPTTAETSTATGIASAKRIPIVSSTGRNSLAGTDPSTVSSTETNRILQTETARTAAASSTLTPAAIAKRMQRVTSAEWIAPEEDFPTEGSSTIPFTEMSTPTQIVTSKTTFSEASTTVPMNLDWSVFSITEEGTSTEILSSKMSTSTFTLTNTFTDTEASASNETATRERTLMFSSTRAGPFAEVSSTENPSTMSLMDSMQQVGATNISGLHVMATTHEVQTENVTTSESSSTETSSIYAFTETNTSTQSVESKVGLTAISLGGSTPTVAMKWDRPVFSTMEETVESEKAPTLIFTGTSTPTAEETNVPNESFSTQKTPMLASTGDDSLEGTASSEGLSTFRTGIQETEAVHVTSAVEESNTLALTATTGGAQTVTYSEMVTTEENFQSKSPSAPRRIKMPTQTVVSKIPSTNTPSEAAIPVTAITSDWSTFSTRKVTIPTEIGPTEETSIFVPTVVSEAVLKSIFSDASDTKTATASLTTTPMDANALTFTITTKETPVTSSSRGSIPANTVLNDSQFISKPAVGYKDVEIQLTAVTTTPTVMETSTLPTNVVSDSAAKTDKRKAATNRIVEMDIPNGTLNALLFRDSQEKNIITTTATKQPLASKPENVEIPTRNIFSESLSMYIPTEMSILSRTVLTEINSTPILIEAGTPAHTATTNQNPQLLPREVSAYRDTTLQTDTIHSSTQSSTEASTQSAGIPIKDLLISSFMGKITPTETLSSEGSSMQTPTEIKASTRTTHKEVSTRFETSIPSAITNKWLIPLAAEEYVTMKAISRESTDTSIPTTANTSAINVTTKTQSKSVFLGTGSPTEAAAVEEHFQTENPTTRTSTEVVPSENTRTLVLTETDSTTAAEASRENEIASVERTDFRERRSTFISTETNMIQQTESSIAIETSTVVPTAVTEDAQVTTSTERFMMEESMIVNTVLNDSQFVRKPAVGYKDAEIELTDISTALAAVETARLPINTETQEVLMFSSGEAIEHLVEGSFNTTSTKSNITTQIAETVVSTPRSSEWPFLSPAWIISRERFDTYAPTEMSAPKTTISGGNLMTITYRHLRELGSTATVERISVPFTPMEAASSKSSSNRTPTETSIPAQATGMNNFLRSIFVKAAAIIAAFRERLAFSSAAVVPNESTSLSTSIGTNTLATNDSMKSTSMDASTLISTFVTERTPLLPSSGEDTFTEEIPDDNYFTAKSMGASIDHRKEAREVSTTSAVVETKEDHSSTIATPTVNGTLAATAKAVISTENTSKYTASDINSSVQAATNEMSLKAAHTMPLSSTGVNVSNTSSRVAASISTESNILAAILIMGFSLMPKHTRADAVNKSTEFVKTDSTTVKLPGQGIWKHIPASSVRNKKIMINDFSSTFSAAEISTTSKNVETGKLSGSTFTTTTPTETVLSDNSPISTSKKSNIPEKIVTMDIFWPSLSGETESPDEAVTRTTESTGIGMNLLMETITIHKTKITTATTKKLSTASRRIDMETDTVEEFSLPSLPTSVETDTSTNAAVSEHSLSSRANALLKVIEDDKTSAGISRFVTTRTDVNATTHAKPTAMSSITTESAEEIVSLSLGKSITYTSKVDSPSASAFYVLLAALLVIIVGFVLH